LLKDKKSINIGNWNGISSHFFNLKKDVYGIEIIEVIGSKNKSLAWNVHWI
jgi:hypothetical protein